MWSNETNKYGSELVRTHIYFHLLVSGFFVFGKYGSEPVRTHIYLNFPKINNTLYGLYYFFFREREGDDRKQWTEFASLPNY